MVKQSGEIVYFESGQTEAFPAAFRSTEKIDEFLEIIEGEIYDGMPTRKIYKRAFQMLKKSSKAGPARYNLKSAIQSLGRRVFSLKSILPCFLQPTDTKPKPIFFWPEAVFPTNWMWSLKKRMSVTDDRMQVSLQQ